MTKASTLTHIQNNIPEVHVPKLIYFSVSQWKEDKSLFLLQIQREFNNKFVAIRSSAIGEDDNLNSHAGEFLSILNIDVKNVDMLESSISRVISSYQCNSRMPRNDDEVIIQEMCQDVAVSGVVFTRDLSTGAPYYCIEYDDITGRSDVVTAGMSNLTKTFYVARKNGNRYLKSPRFRKLLFSISEIEQFYNNSSLDIEFVIDTFGNVTILQVRQIASSKKWAEPRDEKVNDYIHQAFHDMDELQLCGDTVLARMPDWNPAEIIGVKPKPLALSLYQELITNDVWRDARSLMGYHRVTNGNLLQILSGQPFVNTRKSFASLLPASLEPNLKTKITNLYIKKLADTPAYHDKIEFKICITCKSLNLQTEIDNKLPELTKEEKKKFALAIEKLSNNIIKNWEEDFEQLSNNIEILERYEFRSHNDTPQKKVQKLFEYVRNIKKYGTLTFAIFARHGFISKSVMNSLFDEKIITQNQYEKILSNVRTITGEFVEDLEKLKKKQITQEVFLNKYGHLRPGTYEITSPTYRENFESIFRSDLNSGEFDEEFIENSNEINHSKVNYVLKLQNFPISSESLLRYFKESTKMREYSKFIFTKHLSKLIDLLAEIGSEMGLSKDEVSYLSLNDFHKILDQPYKNINMRDTIVKNIDNYKTSKLVSLPSILIHPQDVYVIVFQDTEPNFITTKNITGDVIIIESELDGVDISGKILVLEKADPGFDWIFGHNIIGLITKYGGANSHMAIRCSELDIPAVIGVGEKMHKAIMGSKALRLDCLQKLVTKIS